MVITNLRVQKRSNVKPRVGDVFRLKLPDETFLFGRVIEADLPYERAPMPTSNLLYIYSPRAVDPQPALGGLTPDRLLIAPTFTNRMLWTKGYAVTVGNFGLSQTDLVPQHCFWDVLRTRYCDESGVTLAERHEPCGSWGLRSYRMLDDLISDQLGIERAPLQEGDVP